MTIRFSLLLVGMCGLGFAAETWSPAPGQHVFGDGRLQLGGLELGLCHYDATWQPTSTISLAAAPTVQSISTWHREGTWKHSAGVARMSEDLNFRDGVWTINAAASDAGPTAAFALNLILPGDLYRTRWLRVDQQRVILSATSAQPTVRALAPAINVDVPLPTGGFLSLSGSLHVFIQDNQKWGRDSFTVRLVGDAGLTLAVQAIVRPVATTPIPLPATVGRPRRDDQENDQLGGWTDQGDNDLRILASGPLQAAGIAFAITDNAVVLAGAKHPWLPRSVDIPVAGLHGTSLYLLHAIAWSPKGEAPIGSITVTYADGTNDELLVNSNRDVADWWNPPSSLTNGGLGWEGHNGHANVGLFASRFPLRDQPLTGLRLATSGTSVWMVPGLAIGEESPLRFRIPLVVKADDRWLPTPTPWEVMPGSALDLSELTPAPVSDRVVMVGDHFALATNPTQPLRLLGANLCFDANFPNKPDAERMARAFRSMGHNAVRIHHYDNQLTRRTGDGTELDLVQLDKLDYLIACCKREGLWITTDLYVSRHLPKGSITALPDREIGKEFKALIPLLPEARANWKRFATNFLTHRNPYTGMTLAEDPVLATLSLVNEDNLPAWCDRDAEMTALTEHLFSAWLSTQPGEIQAEAVAKPAARVRLRGTWLWQCQRDAYAELRAHAISLGVTAPTTGANMMSDWWTTALRDGFDFVDNHQYFDHPHFPVKTWQLPFSFGQGSPLTGLFNVPNGIAASRRLDRPFTVSEVNFCLPNRNRHQYAAAMPGIAGMQGWSGIWRFAFAHSLRTVTDDLPATGFDLAHDPISLLGERAMALLWRRGDVVPATWAAGLAYTPEIAAQSVGQDPDQAFSSLALYGRIGCLPAGTAQTAPVSGLVLLVGDAKAGPVPSGVRPVLPADGKLPEALRSSQLLAGGAFDPVAGIVRSADGQLACNAKAGSFSVTTPRSVAVVLPGKSTATVGGLILANPDADSTTVIVAALDSGTLLTSHRLLVLHLTDALNSGMSFADQRCTQLDNWGKAPVLVRDGHLILTVPGDTPLIANALDLQGVIHDSVQLIPVAGGQQLDAHVAHAWGPCLAWLIVR